MLVKNGIDRAEDQAKHLYENENIISMDDQNLTGAFSFEIKDNGNYSVALGKFLKVEDNDI